MSDHRTIEQFHATRESGSGCPEVDGGPHYFAFIDSTVDYRVCIDCGAPEPKTTGEPGRNPTMSKHVETTPWEYGFYDSETGPDPIWWYTFGGLVGFESAGQAEHTASKSTWGAPVIVRRRKGETEWEQVSDVER